MSDQNAIVASGSRRPKPANASTGVHACLAVAILAPNLAMANANCQAPDRDRTQSAPVANPELAAGALQVEAGHADISQNGDMRLSDDVGLIFGEHTLSADEVEFERNTQHFRSSGAVRYQDSNLLIEAGAANVSADDRSGSFEDASFELRNGDARGGAGSIELSEQRGTKLTEVEYTTCPRNNDDWVMRASTIKINHETEQGSARNALVRFKGIPLIYLPYIGFPASDKRQSGLLTPSFGSTSTSGIEIAWPWYWNIAPNYDATLTPRLLADRGLQLGGEFRYIQRQHRGLIDGSYLNDTKARQDRTLWSIKHLSAGKQWLANVNFARVGDRDHYDDLGGSQQSVSTRFLDRTALLQWENDSWNASILSEEFDLLGRSAQINSDPFRRTPEFSLQYRPQLNGPVVDISTVASRFDHDSRRGLWRAHADPTVGWEFRRPGWYLRPEASWMYSYYSRASNLSSTVDDRGAQTRALPRASVDGAMYFDRHHGDTQQTITVQARYLYIPFRDQSNLPLIDTGLPDFALPWLFENNRYTGPDRIGDSNSIATAIRFDLRRQGREVLTTAIGRRYDLRPTRVRVPGENLSQRHSDVLLAAQLQFADYWRLNADTAFQADRRELSRSTADLHWAKGGRRVSLGWRQRTGFFEQSSLDFVMPIGSNWKTAGGWRYSLRDNATLETFLALEYQSCCWAARVAGKRYIRSDGEPDNSIQVQLELTGLGSLGDSFKDILDHELPDTWLY